MNLIYLAPYTLPEGEKAHTYEHTLGRRLLSLGLKELFGLDVTPEWLDANIRTQKSGKPFIFGLPHIHYNISHCAGMVACAFADSPVGVDVEKIRPVKDNLIARVLTGDERVYLSRVSADEASRAEWFTRFWTLKESYLKYTGAGLSGSLQSVSFRFEEHFSENEPRITCSDPSVTLFEAPLSGGIILSACTGSKEPFSLRSVSLP